MLVGPLDEAVNAAALVAGSHGGARLTPRLLTDGRYALPESVLTDAECAAAHPIVSEWDVESPSSSDFVAPGAGYPAEAPIIVKIGDVSMSPAGRRGSVTMPDVGVFRFEVQPNDFAGPFDYGWPEFGGVNKRRSQLLAFGPDRAAGTGDGETLWQSFCFILGDTPGYANSSFARIISWHSVDYGTARSGILGIDAAGGELDIYTRSSASTWPETGNGIPVDHYTTTIPNKGEKTHVVLQATFGEEGHLNVWINGSQVVDDDTPIGYYDDLVAHPGADMGWPEIGAYLENLPTTEVVYVANMEWGADLSDRITSPLSVPDLTW